MGEGRGSVRTAGGQRSPAILLRSHSLHVCSTLHSFSKPDRYPTILQVHAPILQVHAPILQVHAPILHVHAPIFQVHSPILHFGVISGLSSLRSHGFTGSAVLRARKGKVRVLAFNQGIVSEETTLHFTESLALRVKAHPTVCGWLIIRSRVRATPLGLKRANTAYPVEEMAVQTLLLPGAKEYAYALRHLQARLAGRGTPKRKGFEEGSGWVCVSSALRKFFRVALLKRRALGGRDWTFLGRSYLLLGA
eukprot:scaffold3473_cov122-Isochrysis_galbana.AAC.3